MRRLEAGETQELLSAVTRRGEVVVEGHPVGQRRRLRLLPRPGGGGRREEAGAARRPPGAARGDAAPRGAWWRPRRTAPSRWPTINALTWDGVPIARLRRGASALRPRVQMLDSEFLDGAQRERLRVRLQRFLDDRIARRPGAPVAPRPREAMRAARLRGLLHRLTEALGLIPGDEGEALPPPARAALKAIGVKAGRFALFMPALLKPRAAAMRALLGALQHGAGRAGAAAPGSGLAAAAAGLAGRVRRGHGLAGGRAGAAAARYRGAGRGGTGLGDAARCDGVAGRPGVALLAQGRLLPVVLRRSGSASCRPVVWPRTNLGPRRRRCCCRCGDGGRSRSGRCSPGPRPVRRTGGTEALSDWRRGCPEPVQLAKHRLRQLQLGRRQVLAQVVGRRGARDQQDVGRAVTAARRAPPASASRPSAAATSESVEDCRGREAAEREERHIGDARRRPDRRSARRRRGGRDCSGSARRRPAAIARASLDLGRRHVAEPEMADQSLPLQIGERRELLLDRPFGSARGRRPSRAG